MKKRSGAKPPERIVFFIDRSLGKRDVPNALRAAGYECEIHDEHFPPDTEDADWLHALAGKRWVVLTKDERIRYRPLEIGALRAAALRVFIAICGNVTGSETARILLAAMPHILDAVRRHDGGALIAYVYKNGRIRVQ